MFMNTQRSPIGYQGVTTQSASGVLTLIHTGHYRYLCKEFQTGPHRSYQMYPNVITRVPKARTVHVAPYSPNLLCIYCGIAHYVTSTAVGTFPDVFCYPYNVCLWAEFRYKTMAKCETFGWDSASRKCVKYICKIRSADKVIYTIFCGHR